jgi:hypothetical protein
MKKKSSIIAVITLLALAACKKDKGTMPPAPQEPAPQIASIKETINAGGAVDITKTFVYDAENRLKEIKYSGAYNITERYNYTGNLIQYRYFSGATEISTQFATYALNNNGRVENWIRPGDNTTTTYEYNNSGYITRINYTLNSIGIGYDIYHYSGTMVLDSISVFAANGGKAYVNVFTYETGKRNTIGNENKGLKVLGKDQAAPLKSKTVFRLSSNGIRQTHNSYSYQYSNDGRIAKMTNTHTIYSNGVPVQAYIAEQLEYTYKQ